MICGSLRWRHIQIALMLAIIGPNNAGSYQGNYAKKKKALFLIDLISNTITYSRGIA